MAFLQYIDKRITYKYRDSSLDESDYVCTAKVLAPTKVVEGNDYDDGGSVTFRVVAPAGFNKVDISDAIRDTFTYGGCSCSYDCCGCSSTYAIVGRVGPRDYRVLVRTLYNY